MSAGDKKIQEIVQKQEKILQILKEIDERIQKIGHSADIRNKHASIVSRIQNISHRVDNLIVGENVPSTKNILFSPDEPPLAAFVISKLANLGFSFSEGEKTQLSFDNGERLSGSSSIARYLARISEQFYNNEALEASKIDYFVELSNSLKKSESGNLEALKNKLAESNAEYLVSNKLSLADIYVWESLKYLQVLSGIGLLPEFAKFVQKFDQQEGFKEALSKLLLPRKQTPEGNTSKKEMFQGITGDSHVLYYLSLNSEETPQQKQEENKGKTKAVAEDSQTLYYLTLKGVSTSEPTKKKDEDTEQQKNKKEKEEANAAFVDYYLALTEEIVDPVVAEIRNLLQDEFKKYIDKTIEPEMLKIKTNEQKEFLKKWIDLYKKPNVEEIDKFVLEYSQMFVSFGSIAFILKNVLFGKTFPRPSKKKEKDEKPAETQKKDEDFDLFGSDDEDEEREREIMRRAQELEEKKKAAGKVRPAAKSAIVLDVKPWDDTTDLKTLEEEIRKIEMEGLEWKAAKQSEIGYGIKKLQISCHIVDELVSVDTIQEKN